MPAWLNALLDWISQNPNAAGLLVFLVAMGESLLIVGILVPGAIMMIGFGTLIAIGKMPLLSTLGWAIAGAIAGDGVSFWIGYYFKDRLRGVWPFRRSPHILAQGEAFFRRHGGKSIVFGRFVGPVRAVIPTVAGMMRMKPLHFTVTNVLSAVAWAPTYILPGFVIGASLDLALQVAARLGGLIVGALLLLYVTFVGTRAVTRIAQRHVSQWLTAVHAWSQTRPAVHAIVNALLDPTVTETRALSLMGVMLILASAIFSYLLLHVGDGSPLGPLDSGLTNLLQQLRTPLMDEVMIGITQLGDQALLWVITLSLAVWWLVRGDRKTAGYWFAAVAFTAISTELLKALLQIPRPETGHSLTGYSFPSGHTAVGTSLYGFGAVIAATALAPARRWIPYTLAALLVISIGFSRLYLGAHWFTDVAGGLCLGLAWITLCGTAYRHHIRQAIATPRHTMPIVIVVFTLAAVYLPTTHDKAAQRYVVKPAVASIDTRQWWTSGWQEHDVQRVDLEGELSQPLTIQYSGSLESLRQGLLAQGWHATPPISFTSLLAWLNPTPSLDTLPVLPQIHRGRYPDLQLGLGGQDQAPLLVLRLWRSGYVFGDNGQPLWIGNVSELSRSSQVLFTFAVTKGNFTAPLAQFEHFLASYRTRTEQRLPENIAALTSRYEWSGKVLLVSEQANR